LSAAEEAADAADLARFEWLWLQSYHAAEAEPLVLAELAGLDPEALLAVMLVRHPAAIAGQFAPGVHERLGAEVPGLSDAEAILLTRPDADVLVAPATAVMATMLTLAEKPHPIGNLLAPGSEVEGEHADGVDAAMQALVGLINAGALVRAG
jgi:hypothetical protein